MKHILRWALPSPRSHYLQGMNETGPVFTNKKSEALVFNSRKEAMLHPANLITKCSFEPIPLRGR